MPNYPNSSLPFQTESNSLSLNILDYTGISTETDSGPDINFTLNIPLPKIQPEIPHTSPLSPLVSRKSEDIMYSILLSGKLIFLYFQLDPRWYSWFPYYLWLIWWRTFWLRRRHLPTWPHMWIRTRNRRVCTNRRCHRNAREIEVVGHGKVST